MKKTILAMAALSFFGGKSMAQTQALPDGKFESWETGKTYEGDAYDDLANPFWESLNILATLDPTKFTGPVTLFKDKGRSGAADDFAPKLRSNFLKFGENQEIFLPGVVGALTVLIDDQSATFGRPFTSRPKAIKGYMKYEPVNGDSASIFVEVYKYNAAAGKRQTIGRIEQIYKEKVENWTEFNLPIEYTNDLTPDSITVLFVSSAGYDFDDLFNCKGQIGSTLWVDDVEFVYDNVANETNEVLAGAKLYPNPSVSGVFNLNVAEACGLEVFSVSGQLIMQKNLATAGEYTVDLSRFAPGVYYIRLSNNDGMAALKAIKR
ncbi:MAG: PCMD domain-containing protein [Bacteroides sp.]|nr:PCMD domain-containing protein [Ruminococcus flavefaciens]MCM1554791.1 PCMD domain-containing protein [Bacteroides sp.]